MAEVEAVHDIPEEPFAGGLRLCPLFIYKVEHVGVCEFHNLPHQHHRASEGGGELSARASYHVYLILGVQYILQHQDVGVFNHSHHLNFTATNQRLRHNLQPRLAKGTAAVAAGQPRPTSSCI